MSPLWSNGSHPIYFVDSRCWIDIFLNETDVNWTRKDKPLCERSRKNCFSSLWYGRFDIHHLVLKKEASNHIPRHIVYFLNNKRSWLKYNQKNLKFSRPASHKNLTWLSQINFHHKNVWYVLNFTILDISHAIIWVRQ